MVKHILSVRLPILILTFPSSNLTCNAHGLEYALFDE